MAFIEEAAKGGLVRFWSEKDWRWNPARSRWSETAGRPKRCVMAEATTEGLPPRERYALWQSLAYYNFKPERPTQRQRRDFNAWGYVLISPDCEFSAFRSDAVSGTRSAADCRRDGGDSLTIGLVIEGQRQFEFDDGAAGAASRGEFFVYDAAQPSRFGWSAHEGAYLVLPRNMAQAVFGGDVPHPARIGAALSASPLAPHLRTQFAMAAQGAAKMRARDQAALLESMKHLLLSALWSTAGDERQEAFRQEGVLAAARQYIAAHLHDPGLHAGTVARAAGCSRASLYRLFAEAGLTVAGYIRELKLQRVRRLLETAPGAAIGDIAGQCGFVDSSNFSRLFRQRFGVTPSEFREDLLRLEKEQD